jgi:hypothetical protein
MIIRQNFLSSLGTSELGAKMLGSCDHVAEGRFDFSIFAGLQTTIRVDPKDVAFKDSKHLLNAVCDFFF